MTRPILLCAGGTGGHLFPAESLAVVLKKRGLALHLATDKRTAQFKFPAEAVHLISSATVRGRNPLALARTVAALGFGGYPTVPPLLAAYLRRVPTILHEQNGVMGRANRLLASRVTAIATGFPNLKKFDARLQAKLTFTGNPVRPQVTEASAIPYAAPALGGTFNLLVFGGSQGARIMSEVVPAAIERLEPGLRARLNIVQQARGEDLDHVRAVYARLGVTATCEGFFSDLPSRMATAHLVISRSGASTVAELSAIGRPALLVPLPHALDQDQLANAMVLQAAGGAITIEQRDFTPDRGAADIARLASGPDRLSAMAVASKSCGALDAAERLADVVMRVARI